MATVESTIILVIFMVTGTIGWNHTRGAEAETPVTVGTRGLNGARRPIVVAPGECECEKWLTFVYLIQLSLSNMLLWLIVLLRPSSSPLSGAPSMYASWNGSCSPVNGIVFWWLILHSLATLLRSAQTLSFSPIHEKHGYRSPTAYTTPRWKLSWTLRIWNFTVKFREIFLWNSKN